MGFLVGVRVPDHIVGGIGSFKSMGLGNVWERTALLNYHISRDLS